MPAKVGFEQAKKFAQAFLRGQPHKAAIASTIFRDKILGAAVVSGNSFGCQARLCVGATTIHDLVPLHYPKWVTARTRSMHSRKYTNAARTCSVIFANSAFTADDTAGTLEFPRERIVVAHPGIGEEFTLEGPPAGRAPYLLTVATLEPRKNLGTLVEAFRLLADTDCALAVVGGAGWGDQPALDRPGIDRLGRVRDAELAWLYRGAAAVVYPSRFEGFGMPITEAMACGAPVVASSHPSLDEASGDAAVRCRPGEPGGDRGRDPRGARPARRAARARARPRANVLLGANRRALPRGVPPIRVAIDTTPLAPDARRHRPLPARAAWPTSTCDVEEVSFPASSRLRAVAADALWYPRLRADGADVLHCPTFRGPFRSVTPLVVTVHDLAVLRHPEWFNRWTRPTRGLPCRASSGPPTG